jgi:hypothetical protein
MAFCGCQPGGDVRFTPSSFDAVLSAHAPIMLKQCGVESVLHFSAGIGQDKAIDTRTPRCGQRKASKLQSP